MKKSNEFDLSALSGKENIGYYVAGVLIGKIIAFQTKYLEKHSFFRDELSVTTIDNKLICTIFIRISAHDEIEYLVVESITIALEWQQQKIATIFFSTILTFFKFVQIPSVINHHLRKTLSICGWKNKENRYGTEVDFYSPSLFKMIN